MRTGESTKGIMVLGLREINPSSRPPTPVFPRLWLYPQMVIDPIHGHPSWAVVLVAVSVGECTDRLGPQKAGAETGILGPSPALEWSPYWWRFAVRD